MPSQRHIVTPSYSNSNGLLLSFKFSATPDKNIIYTNIHIGSNESIICQCDTRNEANNKKNIGASCQRIYLNLTAFQGPAHHITSSIFLYQHDQRNLYLYYILITLPGNSHIRCFIEIFDIFVCLKLLLLLATLNYQGSIKGT